MRLGGCVLAFAGNWAISLIRSFKLLDDDRAKEVEDAAHAIDSLSQQAEQVRQETEKLLSDPSIENSELKKPRRPVAQQIVFDQAKVELAKLGSPEITFIRALIHHEQVEHQELHRTLTTEGMSREEWMAVVATFRKSQPLVADSLPTPFDPHEHWRINPYYREVLLEILGP